MIARILFLMPLASLALYAQGPTLSYLADRNTDLPWAECRIYLQGGSQQKIPFLPVVNAKWAPCGTDKYTRDIRVDARVAFVGDGVVQGDADPYCGLDVAGAIVMFSYDFPDSANPGLDKKVPFESRIREAVARKAAGVVVFSWVQDYPFPRYRDAELDTIPEIPIVAINRQSAEVILRSGGLDPSRIFDKWKAEGAFIPQLLISRLALRIDGKFEHVSTDNFDFYYERGKIGPANIATLAEVNEKSVKFLLDLFRAEKMKWRKVSTVYFCDYDSKLFFTHHWGKGASDYAGIFMVFDGSLPAFGLAAHENAHSLIGDNWGGSSSFLFEGLGKYAEAMATDPAANDKTTAVFLKESKLVPLEKMLTIDIGSDPLTEVAYPAAGSFVGFLIRKYSLAKVKTIYQHATEPGIWTKVFGVTISELEKDWISSLSNR